MRIRARTHARIAVCAACTACTALFAGAALADDVPLTAEQFKSQMVGKKLRATSLTQSVFDLELQEGGKAIVSNAYNDVGRWRTPGGNEYCIVWNKLSPTERCYRVVQRDGKLGQLGTDGKLLSWIEALP